ncbi:DUF4190 domain-containing protein [Gottfriedia sp. NPDC057948]|uniref:DUF4190 domain-containing protein n=1 Tax=Gottfriedia sp. NPDC057948 TaxID=3346287 RepID=UPI0036DB516C
MEITNPKAKFALTLAILSLIIPAIGLILAVIGLYMSKESLIEIKRINQKGRGLALSAKIISIISICIDALALLLVVILAIIGHFFTK